MTPEALPKQYVNFNQTIYQAHKENPLLFLHDIHPQDAPGFLVSSPVPVLVATCAYILFVTVVGPFWMRNREPYQLRSIIRFYNLLEVFISGYMLHKLVVAIGPFGNFFDCSKTFTFADSSVNEVYGLANMIISVRLSEYMDTIFFTLRKKQNQVTFLHVFHHAFVPLYAYWVLRTGPFRFNVYIFYINLAVHVVMYFYYFLATFQQSSGNNGKPSKSGSIIMKIITQLLKYKKYVTQMQILQFVSLNFYVLYAYIQPNRCGIPKTYIISNFLLGFGFLALFVHFYVRAYKQSQLARKQAAKRNV